MAGTVNKVILVGRLGADPEIRYTPSGMAVANVSLATNEVSVDKQTSQKQEKTEWHRVVFFERLAEVVGEYLKKGALIYVEGRIQTRKWQDQSGVDRWSTEIIAQNMQMLGGRSDSQGNYAPAASSGYAPSTPPPTSDKPSSYMPPPPANDPPPPANTARSNSAPNNFDDDIPF